MYMALISLVFNAWLAHMPLKNNGTASLEELSWVIQFHYKFAHLLFFTSLTHRVLFWQLWFQITWPIFEHQICHLYSQTGTLNMCHLCSSDKKLKKFMRINKGGFASQDWNDQWNFSRRSLLEIFFYSIMFWEYATTTTSENFFFLNSSDWKKKLVFRVLWC